MLCKKIINHKKLNGLSLVELMIGLTLSLVVTMGMVNVFITNKQTMQMTRTLNILQENIRYSEVFMTRHLLLVGYRSPPSSSSPQDFSTFSDVYPSSAPHISASDNSGTNNSDVLTIRYQGSGDGAGTADGSILDCARVGVDSNAMATNVISISASNQLQCQATNTTGSSSSNTITLINNVENMQVLLGEDTDNDGYANRYVNGAYSNLENENIVSVRLALLFTSDNNAVTTVDNNSYTLLDATWNPADDNRLRKIMSKSIQLRNKGSGL